MAIQPIYQFYAELNDFEPKTWRCFQVLGNTTIARLGYIVMTLFEMQASHLFSIEANSEYPMASTSLFRYEVPDEELESFDEPGVRVLDATQWKLGYPPQRLKIIRGAYRMAKVLHP